MHHAGVSLLELRLHVSEVVVASLDILKDLANVLLGIGRFFLNPLAPRQAVLLGFRNSLAVIGKGV